MHYSRYQGSKEYGKEVIVPKEPNVEIGQREKPSNDDIRQIKRMYRCNGKYDWQILKIYYWLRSFVHSLTHSITQLSLVHTSNANANARNK